MDGILEAAERGRNFRLLFFIRNFTYEMVENQGGNCHGRQFQEAKGRMPAASALAGLIILTHFISKIG